MLSRYVYLQLLVNINLLALKSVHDVSPPLKTFALLLICSMCSMVSIIGMSAHDEHLQACY